MSEKYASAGVDLSRGRQFVERLKPLAEKTRTPGVMDRVGGFAAAFDLSVFDYKDPILVSGTDGVGTKLKLAILLDRYKEVGIDLVAMSVNDVLVCGARPLFFLDYYAAGKLDVERGLQVIQGITQACMETGCALVGGETAEMPGMYHGDDFDLAGFCVGAVERGLTRGSERVAAGDVILGLESSGPHSNGFSLIRKLITSTDGSLKAELFHNGTRDYLDQLMAPTRLYVRPILRLLENVDIHAMAHITGGGFFENIPRSIQSTQQAVVSRAKLPQRPLFEWLVHLAKMDKDEPYHVWNMGIGFTVILPQGDVNTARRLLADDGITSTVIGEVTTKPRRDAPSFVMVS